jgi:hypothetical protein
MRHNRGHKSSGSVGFGNTSTNLDLPGASPSATTADVHDHSGHKHGHSHSVGGAHDGHEKKKNTKRSGHLERQRKRRKAMASIIVDQLGGALGQVALKNSKFNSSFSNLESAKQLARKLFSALSEGDVHPHPPRKYLIVEGQFSGLLSRDNMPRHTRDIFKFLIYLSRDANTDYVYQSLLRLLPVLQDHSRGSCSVCCV